MCLLTNTGENKTPQIRITQTVMTKTIKTAPCVPSCGLHFSKCVLLVYYKDILEKIVSE